MAALRAAGVTPLVLRRTRDGSDAASAFHDRQLRILVAPDLAHVARAAMERLPWRYSWRRGGPLRLAPMSYYWWDGGADLELCWGDVAAPLPSWTLRRVTAALWASASTSAAGYLEPDPAALLVHLAVQSCRPGASRDDDWGHFRHCLSTLARDGAMARAEQVARESGVSRALRHCVAAAESDHRRPGGAAIFDGPLAWGWRAVRSLTARAASARLQRVLAAAPTLGDTAIRCRAGDVEVVAERGVFVPTPDVDLFVELATARLAGRERPVVVEIGTGCGAIALATAHARPDAVVHGTDLFRSAVRSARRNATALGLQHVRFDEGSLLTPLPASLAGRIELLIANLPFYPAEGYAAIGSVPRGTIQGGGDDGLTLVRALAREARAIMRPGGRLLLQMFATQWELFVPELVSLGYHPGEARTFGPFVIGAADLAADRDATGSGRA